MRAKKKAAKPVAPTPREANTNAKVCAMPRDNWSARDFWIMVDETEVTIAKQRNGEPAEWSHSIPKHVFNRFVDFYNTGKSRRLSLGAGQ